MVTITNKKLSTFNKVGKIVHLPETEYGFVQIVLSDGNPAMTKITSIEKVNTTNTNPNNIQIGDMVIVNDPYLGIEGKTGFIYEKGMMDNQHYVKVNVQGKKLIVNTKYVVPYASSNPNDTKLKVYDKIIVVNKTHNSYGNVATVIDAKVIGGSIVVYDDTIGEYMISPHSVIKIPD